MKKVGYRESRFGRSVPAPDRDLVAAQVLAFLAADPERLGRFLALTGLDPSTIRMSATHRGFTAAILGYLASDDALLAEFARSQGHDPEHIGRLTRFEQQSWEASD